MRSPGGSGGGRNIPREASGPPVFPRVYSNAPVTVDRARGNNNDSGIIKDKRPWFHNGYGIPAGTGAANFDQKTSGPAPVTLHLRTYTYREEAGDGHRDTTGMHTIMPKIRTNQGSRKPAIMQSGRQNRLTTGIFRGQTFSETTEMQGRLEPKK